MGKNTPSNFYLFAANIADYHPIAHISIIAVEVLLVKLEREQFMAHAQERIARKGSDDFSARKGAERRGTTTFQETSRSCLLVLIIAQSATVCQTTPHFSKSSI